MVQRIRRLRRPGKQPRWRLLLLGALLLALVPATAVAAELTRGDTILITSPVDDDLYAFGSDVVVGADVSGDITVVAARVRIFGDVGGSVYAAAATVTIDGDVGGTVMTLSASVTVRGTVGQAMRAVARDVRLTGAQVNGDLVAAASDVRADEQSRVGGDLWLRASDVRVDADVGGQVRGGADEWRIAGTVDGPIDVRAGTLRFAHGAVINQPVRYVSDYEVLIDTGTSISAEMTRVEPDHPSFSERAERTVLFIVLRYFWALSLGLFLLRVAAHQLTDAGDALRNHPWGALWRGALALVGVPVAILALLVTVIGLPVALLVLVVFLFAMYASQIVVGIVVGRELTAALARGRRTASLRQSLALGLLIVVVVRSLPIPNWYVFSSIVTAIAALGAIVLVAMQRPRRAAPAI
jgi:hypothetical protein